MTLTAADLFEHIDQTLGTDEEALPFLSRKQIVDQAGEYLVGMHQWDWLVRPPVTLELEADQGYLELPADFQALVWVDTSEGLVRSLRLTTLGKVLQLRTDGLLQGEWDLWGAIVWAPTLADPVPRPRLELYPTPGSSGDVQIVYRAGWTPIETDSDRIGVPSWCEGLLVQLVRAYARGYEEEDQSSMQERLALVSAGPEFQVAVRRDAGVQTSYGSLGGGAAAMSVMHSWPHGYSGGPIGGPT